mgnify:CR=1 FL=1
MPFNPRLTEEITHDMAARVVARGKLTDMSEGSAVLSLITTFAEEIAYVEYRMKRIRNSFSFEGSIGSDLDERVRDLPPPGLERQGARSAAGAVMQITLTDEWVAEGVALTVPAGTVYARSDSQTKYVQTTEVIVPAAQKVYPNAAQSLIHVNASSPGTDSNAPSGAISQLELGPEEIEKVSNATAISGGLDREGDEELKQRALLYMSSLARCQPKALEYLGRSFERGKFRHAKLFEDQTRPGLSLLMVDDGFGSLGMEKAGLAVEGEVAQSGAPGIIYHEGPATAEIVNTGNLTQFYIDTGDGNGYVAVPPKADGTMPWVSVCERGIIYPDDGLLAVGDKWKIDNYRVYTSFLSGLQRLIEGEPNDAFSSQGWRASGTRVRVIPPDVQDVSFTINLVVFEAVDFDTTALEIKTETAEFLRALGPGEELFLAGLVSKLMRVDGVKNVNILVPEGDVSPVAHKVLRTTEDKVQVT